MEKAVALDCLSVGISRACVKNGIGTAGQFWRSAEILQQVRIQAADFESPRVKAGDLIGANS
jgi:hypothetical protein